MEVLVRTVELPYNAFIRFQLASTKTLLLMTSFAAEHRLCLWHACPSSTVLVQLFFWVGPSPPPPLFLRRRRGEEGLSLHCKGELRMTHLLPFLPFFFPSFLPSFLPSSTWKEREREGKDQLCSRPRQPVACSLAHTHTHLLGGGVWCGRKKEWVGPTTDSALLLLLKPPGAMDVTVAGCGCGQSQARRRGKNTEREGEREREPDCATTKCTYVQSDSANRDSEFKRYFFFLAHATTRLEPT